MKTPSFLTKRFISNFIRFVAYFALIVLSPLIGDFLGSFFKWVGYGQWMAFFNELWEGLLWLIAINTVLVVEAVYRKKQRKKALAAAENGGETETTIALSETQPSEGITGSKASALPERLAEKKEKWRGPLPLKNVFILAGLCVLAVLIFTAQIGFQVKPFFDLGEKNTAPELFLKVVYVGQNVVKCGWIVLFMQAALAMSEEIFASISPEKKARLGKWLPWLVWIVAGAMLACFGAYDIIVYSSRFAPTYAFFYLLYPIVYYFAKECGGRAYLVIMFIYIF